MVEAREGRRVTPPLERAARAICEVFGVDPDEEITGGDDVHVGLGLKQPHLAWTRYVAMARVTLLAVRDPSDEMVAAADGLSCSMGTVAHWQVMVDAALAVQASSA